MMKIKDVFQIINNTEGGKVEWNKIGVAFENKDGSLNVILNSNPINGKMHIKDRESAQCNNGDPAY